MRILLVICLGVGLVACSNSNPQGEIGSLTDRLCKTMKLIGYQFDDSAIQSLDQSVQDQLLEDISRLKELAPSLLDRPLRELCQ